MDTKQAKDFLVAQAAEQAAIDRVALTDIERRMMYFTESDPASCPDPLALNDEFEARFDSTEYEAKMFQLLDRAEKRLRQEDPERARNWAEAVNELQKGDHYILILLGLAGAPASPERPKHDFLKLLGTAVLVAAVIAIEPFVAGKLHLDARFWIRPLITVFVLAWIMFSRQGRQLLSMLLPRRRR